MIGTKRIEEVEKLVFEFQIPAAMQQFALLTEELIEASGNLAQSQLSELLLIIKVMNTALTTKDYLLLNDLLEFELKPFAAENLS